MGFGSGYSSRTTRGGKSYNNSQTAHVWNAQSERAGQSNNGNFYFERESLYSYGSHFLVGFIMPDGVALLNGSSYSVSTSGHQSDARHAISDRPHFSINGLTDLRDLLRTLARGKLDKDEKARARIAIRNHAESLTSTRLEPGQSRYYWDDGADSGKIREGGESAGQYLTRLAGLPAASWPKLEREAAAIKAKRLASEAKATADGARNLAIRFADMPDSLWRKALSIADRNGSTYDAPRRLESLALDLHRSVRLAKRLGFSNRRRAALSARHKAARARLEQVAELSAIVNRRDSLRRHVRQLRDAAKTWRDLLTVGELPSYHLIANLRYVREAAAALATVASLPDVSRQRLAFLSRRLESVETQLMAEHRAIDDARREAEWKARQMKADAHKAGWIAGDVPLSGLRFDSEHGGAAIRVHGRRLETSHGADVPLCDAVRVFRFIKLVMARGKAWRRNGETIRVGSFQVDSIEPSGAFVAGCHSFAWQEVKAAAIAAGVFTAEPSAEAVNTRESINA